MTMERVPDCKQVIRAFPFPDQTYRKWNPQVSTGMPPPGHCWRWVADECLILLVSTQNVVMICPENISGDPDEDWKFSFEDAWYARVILFFTAQIQRVGRRPNLMVRVAYVQWLHRLDVDSGARFMLSS
jgi:hypothetical protein